MKATTVLDRPMLMSAWLRFLDAPLVTGPTADVVVASLVVGASFDIAVRSGVAGVGGALCISVTCVGMLVTRRIRNPQAIALVCAAPLFGMWLAVRTSVWLIPLDILAAAALLGSGASLARGGSGADMTIPELAGRAARGVLQALFAPAFLFRGAFGNARTRRTTGVVRGLLLAVPILVVLSALLTSADAVFASFFSFDASGVVEHAVLIAIGTLGAAALLRLASAEPAEAPQVEGPKLGSVEVAIVLGALNLVLGAFAVARLYALSEGGRRVIDSAGLTYAEYARSGFFQLVGVAVIVIGALLTLRAAAPRSTPVQRRTFGILAAGVVVLTLAVCVSAFHRLVLYEAAFGLTMLRLYVQTAIVWLAIVLVLLAIGVALPHVTRAWLAPAAAAAGLILLFALNALNPEALVARHNLAHAPQADVIDRAYLGGLSDDALGAVAEGARGDASGAVELRSLICAVDPAVGGTGRSGWASYNFARARAEDVRAELCE